MVEPTKAAFCREAGKLNYGTTGFRTNSQAQIFFKKDFSPMSIYSFILSKIICLKSFILGSGFQMFSMSLPGVQVLTLIKDVTLSS